MVRTVWIFKEKIENLSSGAHVLHVTSNLIRSRRFQGENGVEMFTNVKRTNRACKAFFCSRELMFCGVLVASSWSATNNSNWCQKHIKKGSNIIRSPTGIGARTVAFPRLHK